MERQPVYTLFKESDVVEFPKCWELGNLNSNFTSTIPSKNTNFFYALGFLYIEAQWYLPCLS